MVNEVRLFREMDEGTAGCNSRRVTVHLNSPKAEEFLAEAVKKKFNKYMDIQGIIAKTNAQTLQQGLVEQMNKPQAWQGSNISPYKNGTYVPPFDQKFPDKSDAQVYNDYYKSTLQTPRKSALEELMDGLFDMSEKEQFLIELGYEFYKTEAGIDAFRRNGGSWNKNLELEKIFLQEIKIKFKNFLLQKPVKKLKF